MTTAATHLTTYLNDHLAGATAALELLDTLAQSPAADLNRFATELRTAITEDREALEDLMRRANIERSATRQTAGWIGGKTAQLKLRVDDPSGGSFRTFELLELLAIGIDGKRALWAALSTVPAWAVHNTDVARLARRADAQRAAVETQRLYWAATALGSRAERSTPASP